MKSADSRLFAEEIESSFANVVNTAEALVAIDYNFCFLYLNLKAEKFYNKNRADLIYYTFTYRSIDHKESLRKELRREVGKTKRT